MHPKLDAFAYSFNKKPTDKVKVFVRVKETTADQVSLLENLGKVGFALHTSAGNILTGECEFAKLEDVCNLDFVEFVEVSRPLFAD